MADLHLSADRATKVEAAAVDAVVDPHGPAVVTDHERLVLGGEARRHERRHLLLPVLHALQHEVGWISPGGLNHVADRLQVPPAEAYGVATFYELFRTEPPTHDGPTTHVCVDPACRIAGAEEMAERFEADGGHVHRSPCLGQCERAPAQFVQGVASPDHVPADAGAGSARVGTGPAGLRLLKRVGVVDPTSLDSYREHGGYAALDRAIELGPDAVIGALDDAGLSGRGGAAFPTGRKWRAVRDATGPSKHVVANGDESEPGTFKDRILMEADPFALVEALTIAGLTVSAEQGWVYVRGEYPRPAERLLAAIDQCRAAGLLGEDAAGSGRAFDIELRRGAGAYICGEETALFNSVEGFRGEPRNKPPYPTTHGLFGEPTAINNPETLLNVLPIVTDGADAYRTLGTVESPGTRLFCLSGHVAEPGLYEAPFGIALGDLIEQAGGATGPLAAVLLGGAAGVFVGPDSLGVPLSLEGAREARATLGSGVVMVFDTSADLTDIVVRLAEFFRNESCGQCVPCRVGTERQHEILVRIGDAGGAVSEQRRELIDDIAMAMGDASICGLGHTAASAVRSALDLGLIGEADGGRDG